MTRSKRIAVTGGIGSGKSAVLSMLKERGYPVFSCDGIYAELSGEEGYLSALAELFPGCVKEWGLDRAALSARVFSDESERKKLNALSHPLIMERLIARMRPFALSFAEVPLLFEEGYETLFDGTIVVLRERSARVRAVMERNGLSEEETLARIARQYDYSVLPEGCYPLVNDGSLADLSEKLGKILGKILGTD